MPPLKTKKKLVAGAALIAVVGAFAADILVTTVPEHEGEVLKGYLDPVGIPTKCYGDTYDVVVGQKYTPEECLRSLEKQLIAHAKPVLACVPELEGHPEQLAASVSLAYNIGTSAFCKSSIARNFRAGNWYSACAGFSAWNKAGGKILKGLVRRRADERAICETNLPTGRAK
ncbi:MAG: lysozyme [Desulfovibrio sp.]|jgi:lysozyme|nr:lysozyme [Desulfovibrio sp.]